MAEEARVAAAESKLEEQRQVVAAAKRKLEDAERHQAVAVEEVKTAKRVARAVGWTNLQQRQHAASVAEMLEFVIQAFPSRYTTQKGRKYHTLRDDIRGWVVLRVDAHGRCYSARGKKPMFDIRTVEFQEMMRLMLM